MPRTFTIKIDLGNDAMQHPDDVAAVLREISEQLSGEPFFHTGFSRKIRDANGNTVGTYWAQAER